MDNYVKSQFWKQWTALFLASAIAAYLFSRPLFNVPNLLQIEFAQTFAIFTEYAAGNQGTLYNNILLDFGFILCYSVLFYFSIRIIRDLLEFNVLGKLIVLCFLPGVLDVAENLLMLQMIESDAKYFNLYYWLVRIKWVFAIPGIILVIIITGYQVFIGIDRLYCFIKER